VLVPTSWSVSREGNRGRAAGINARPHANDSLRYLDEAHLSKHDSEADKMFLRARINSKRRHYRDGRKSIARRAAVRPGRGRSRLSGASPGIAFMISMNADVVRTNIVQQI